MEEQKLYEKHPSMFKNRPVGFVLLILIGLILAVPTMGISVLLCLLIFLFWWIKVLGTTLIVTNERVTLRKGILSKHTNEVYHNDIRNVQVSQGIFQRMFGVGTIGIATAGHGEIEIVIQGIPAPEKVKGLIDQHRRQK